MRKTFEDTVLMLFHPRAYILRLPDIERPIASIGNDINIEHFMNIYYKPTISKHPRPSPIHAQKKGRSKERPVETLGDASRESLFGCRLKMVSNISGADMVMCFVHAHGVICVIMAGIDAALVERLHRFRLDGHRFAHDAALLDGWGWGEPNLAYAGRIQSVGF